MQSLTAKIDPALEIKQYKYYYEAISESIQPDIEQKCLDIIKLNPKFALAATLLLFRNQIGIEM
jgi:hypothetical protein